MGRSKVAVTSRSFFGSDGISSGSRGVGFRCHLPPLTFTRGIARNRIASRLIVLALLSALGPIVAFASAKTTPARSPQEKDVPPVEPGSTCNLEEVLRKGGARVQQFVVNLDRFTATESLLQETINKFGEVSGTERQNMTIWFRSRKSGLASQECKNIRVAVPRPWMVRESSQQRDCPNRNVARTPPGALL
jgi:hypothetical protein